MLDIGKPDVIRPAIGEGGGWVTTPMVVAVDGDIARAGLAHLAEDNRLWTIASRCNLTHI
jgi:hypothetical protein